MFLAKFLFPIVENAGGGVLKVKIEQLYEKLGGNLPDVVYRFGSLDRVNKFLAKCVDISALEKLCAAMQAGDLHESFRIAYMIKDLCKNMGFGTLEESVGQLTDDLHLERDQSRVCAKALETLELVKKDYQNAMQAIKEYLEIL